MPMTASITATAAGGGGITEKGLAEAEAQPECVREDTQDRSAERDEEVAWQRPYGLGRQRALPPGVTEDRLS